MFRIDLARPRRRLDPRRLVARRAPARLAGGKLPARGAVRTAASSAVITVTPVAKRPRAFRNARASKEPLPGCVASADMTLL
jgi:hypothetical protein